MIKNELIKKLKRFKAHVIFISIMILCVFLCMFSFYKLYKENMLSQTQINERLLNQAMASDSQEEIAAITEIIDKKYTYDEDWQADGIYKKYFPDVCTVDDIKYSLSPSVLSELIEKNDGSAYFRYMYEFYENLMDATPLRDPSSECKLKAIEFCIQNKVFVSFSNWRFRYIEDSFYEENYEKNSKKAEELRYRAVYNIEDSSISSGRAPTFNHVYAIKQTMELVFLLVLVFAAFISAGDLPSEYLRKTIRLIYRSPKGRIRALLCKAFSSYIISLIFSLLSLAITVLASIPFYGVQGLRGFMLISLGKIVPVNVMVYFLLEVLLQSFEIFVIVMLCMSISVFFINPIPGVIFGTTVSFVSAVYSSPLMKVNEKFWMKYCFPFSMNIRQYIEFDEKLKGLTPTKAVVITAVWILFFGFTILFCETSRDV